VEEETTVELEELADVLAAMELLVGGAVGLTVL
jgi:hypothetical protein